VSQPLAQARLIVLY